MSRDNFKEPVKKILGSRVAYRCCFPGCGILTIGPKMGGPGVVTLGEAAHIHAAAPGGPRYNDAMTTKERCSPDNGIWLCRAHARIIDADEGSYSAETILQWKIKAEAETYRQLMELTKTALPDPTTLICLHPQLIFEGIWTKASGDTWTFAAKKMIYGDLQAVKAFKPGNAEYKDYLIIESQGDGRLIHQFEWTQKTHGILVSVKVAPSLIRRNPEHIGAAPAIGDNMLENGRWRLISGKELALQKIQMILNTPVGSQLMNRGYGTLFSVYYQDHRHDLSLLNRLIKIELTRLITTPTNPEKPEGQPELNFINRINDVDIFVEKEDRVLLNLSLEWGDGTLYKGQFSVYVDQKKVTVPPRLRPLPEKIRIPVVRAPRQQLKELAASFSGAEMKMEVNSASIMKLFQETLPVIMQQADRSLESDIYPLFHKHRLYRFFDNNTFEYLTSYDLELQLLKYGPVRDMGVTIKLDGFKKAGVKAFDVSGDLAFHFEDYYYTIGPFRGKPWFTKLYDQLPDEKELTQITDDFIEDLIKRINDLILSIRQ